MKTIKKGIYILIFLVSLFIMNINAKAYEVNADYIYNNIILKQEENTPDFTFKEYSNVFCINFGDGMGGLTCFFIKNEDIEKVNLIDNYSSFLLRPTTDFKYYKLTLEWNNLKSNFTTFTSTSIAKSKPIYSNIFNDEVESFNYLDFSSYLTPEEEKEELEITIKATNLLNFMIDKTKNIYEVLINNEIFLLCIGVLISYLIFMFLLRIRK